MFGFTVSNITCSKCSKQQSQLQNITSILLCIYCLYLFQKFRYFKKAIQGRKLMASYTPGQGGKQTKKKSPAIKIRLVFG